MKSIPGTKLTVQNVFCIGRNYALHAQELNNPIPDSPVVFLKPTSSICYSGENLIIPKESCRVDHEVEIIIVIGKTGKNIPPDLAHALISHIGIGLDFTARDIQDKAKEKALPWAIAKGFDTFAAISTCSIFEGDATKLVDLKFELKVNGEIRQTGNTKDMLFSITNIVSYLSCIFSLSPGDLIFTGTPAGVSALKAGDKLEAKIENGVELHLGVI
jgi:2-keto-4-pentenoate hydratase/2-oxohepta-3-ene-1,7-dioic acid hydratase in catechol pathway